MIEFLIKVDLGVDGMPKGPIVGNTSCWYGNLRYLTQDVIDPKAKLLKKYNKKKKQFTSVNVGPKIVQKALNDWCQMKRVPKDMYLLGKITKNWS